MAKPHELDGYANRSDRDYKGAFQYSSFFIGMHGSYVDKGVIAIDGSTDEALLIWEFVIDIWRETTEIVPGNVTVHWRDDGDPVFDPPTGPTPTGHYAGFTDGTPGDVHIYLNRAWVGPGGAHFQGMTFLWDVLAHEWTHAWLINAPAYALDMVAALFGKTIADWDTGVWETSVKEAWCETWKDVTLARDKRKYDNRTRLTIPYEKWVAAYDLANEGFPIPGAYDGTPLPAFEGPPVYFASEVHKVTFHLLNATGAGPPFYFTRYTQRSQMDRYWAGGVLEKVLAFPCLYPYFKLAPSPVDGVVGAGTPTQGMVDRGNA